MSKAVPHYKIFITKEAKRQAKVIRRASLGKVDIFYWLKNAMLHGKIYKSEDSRQLEVEFGAVLFILRNDIIPEKLWAKGVNWAVIVFSIIEEKNEGERTSVIWKKMEKPTEEQIEIVG